MNWREAFTVHLEGADPEAPPVLGDYIVEGESVRFRPRFAFAAGLTYRARFGETTLLFTMPTRDPGEHPRVVAVDPSSSEVPANLLRLYITFSHPMWTKDVSKRIHLFDAAGREVPLPFVEIETGLWDSERQASHAFLPSRPGEAGGRAEPRARASAHGRRRLSARRRQRDARHARLRARGVFRARAPCGGGRSDVPRSLDAGLSTCATEARRSKSLSTSPSIARSSFDSFE